MHDEVLMIYLLALLIGIVAGMRSMTAPAAASWAAHLGRVHVSGTWVAFFGFQWTAWILSICALGELIGDQLPNTPSRKSPPAFAFRIVSGAASGAAIGTAGAALLPGLAAGIIGAVIGTMGGYEFRTRLAAAFHKDAPAALIEDAIAVGGGVLVALACR